MGTMHFICRTFTLKKDLKKQKGISAQRTKMLVKRIEYLESRLVQLGEEMDSQPKYVVQKEYRTMITVGTLRVAAESISYITTQAAELPKQGNARIKVFHYTDGRSDMAYGSFAEILTQTGDNFMLINKNQIVNLRQVRRIQGGKCYLENIRSPFIISKQNLEEFIQRFDALSMAV